MADNQPVSYIVFDDIPLERLGARLPRPEAIQSLFNEFARDHPIRARYLAWVLIPMWKLRHKLRRKD